MLAGNGIAVCVFDADVTRTRSAEKAKFEDMKRKYADNLAVILCDSMPSIEFWFLLHYLNTNRYFATSDDVIDVLHRYMPNFSKHQSFLSKEAWVSELLADNRLYTAIVHANTIGMEGESYCRLPKLFEIVDTK